MVRSKLIFSWHARIVAVSGTWSVNISCAFTISFCGRCTSYASGILFFFSLLFLRVVYSFARCIIMNFNGIVCSRDTRFLGTNCVVSFVTFLEEALAGSIIGCASFVTFLQFFFLSFSAFSFFLSFEALTFHSRFEVRRCDFFFSFVKSRR